ncbi:hypothetical protein PILCRDRAFT_11829 [Piloderma croceum F 1598]|uniref:Uncharacterized protein n=1 Tax=Piloderma croceum (strain F 1598) TaxID=765440 RepID=A0A0C3EYY0_PILCF|nr:hypothetical protein PILCRDRAFT_11829 [Piloderma croceum F 1598]
MRRLRTIHCATFDNESYLWIVHPFIGPNLTAFSMHIEQQWDMGEVASLASLTIFKDILRFRSPLLERLTITIPSRIWAKPFFSSLLSMLVCSLQHLRHLHCGDGLELDLPSLVHLASLPDLQILRLPIHQSLDQIFSLTPVPPPFLKHFEIGISVYSLEVAIKFILAWKFKTTTITTICVHITKVDEEPEICCSLIFPTLSVCTFLKQLQSRLSRKNIVLDCGIFVNPLYHSNHYSLAVTVLPRLAAFALRDFALLCADTY